MSLTDNQTDKPPAHAAPEVPRAVGHYAMAKIQLACETLNALNSADILKSDACGLARKAAGLVLEQEMKALMDEATLKEHNGVPNPPDDQPQG